MKNVEKLKAANTREKFAKLLGYEHSDLTYILYGISDQNKYKSFEIPKKHGGKRKIRAPHKKFKFLQRRLSKILTKCFEELYGIKKFEDEFKKKNSYKKSLAHGFRKEHSIFTNALTHHGKRYVFNIDLLDFFPSINFGRVRNYFIKNNQLMLKEEVANTIAKIVCFDNQLPQGSPCSPVISNFIGHILDIRLLSLSKKTGCVYSRYVDDLTFSTNKKKFPKEIAFQEQENQWTVGRKLEREIKRTLFAVNKDKISMQYKTSRQVTTGLIVNKGVNIKKEYYKNARAMCNSLFYRNEFYIKNGKTAVRGTIKQLEGILQYIYNIRRQYKQTTNSYIYKIRDIKTLEYDKSNPYCVKHCEPDDKIFSYKNQNVNIHLKGISKLCVYTFLYRIFCASETPVILTEGKTDIVHFQSALLSLYKDINRKTDEDKKKYFIKNANPIEIEFVDWEKYLKNFIDFTGGTSGLKKLLENYYKIKVKFKKGEYRQPLIMIVDNDSEGKHVKKVRLSKKEPECVQGHNKIWHYKGTNIYIIELPDVDGQDSVVVEDLYDEKTIHPIMNGKTVNKTNEKTKENECSKIDFALKIVKKNRSSIDFSKFKDVFESVLIVIDDYSSTHK